VQIDSMATAQQVCATMQPELGAQLAKLGVRSGGGAQVMFETGSYLPLAEPYAVRSGEWVPVSPTAAGSDRGLCGVSVP
jgi:hypothetical protein